MSITGKERDGRGKMFRKKKLNSEGLQRLTDRTRLKLSHESPLKGYVCDLTPKGHVWVDRRGKGDGQATDCPVESSWGGGHGGSGGG